MNQKRNKRTLKLEEIINNITNFINTTAFEIVETESKIAETILNNTLHPDSSSFIIISQKTAIVVALILLTLIVALVLTALIVLTIDIVYLCYLRHRTYRQRHRFELIPTYHNVRALREDPIIRNSSSRTLPTYPPTPITERATTTFRHE